eukprot:gene14316-15805_t
MDGFVKKFPEPLYKDASPRAQQLNFHPKTRKACSESGNLFLKTSKAIFTGDISVGKTSIINRYCRNRFEKDYKPTIGIDYEIKKYEILSNRFDLQIWDTSGEERFKCITAAYYRGAQAIIVVFDLTELLSLTHASQWIEEALNNTKTTVPEIFLVGNKKDACKSHQFEKIHEDAKVLANELNAEYWDVSAKSGENVDKLFERISAVCFDQAVLKELENLNAKSQASQIGGDQQGIKIQVNKQSYQNQKIGAQKKSCCGS